MYWRKCCGGSVVKKNLPANAGVPGYAGLIPRLGRSPGGGNGSLFPGESHGQEEPGGLQSKGLQRVRHNWKSCVYKMNKTQSFLGVASDPMGQTATSIASWRWRCRGERCSLVWKKLYILDWSKCSSTFFCNILWKHLNKLWIFMANSIYYLSN